VNARRLVALAVVAAFAGCGEAPPPAAGSFVGAVPGTELYVAVVAAAPRAGETERAVRVYVCDRERVNEWFAGRGGDAFALASQGGGWRIEGDVDPEAASGTLTRPDGSAVRFRAAPAKGFAGLYDNVLFPDGRVRGSSETGARLEATLADVPDARGRYKATGVYIAPGGERRPYVTFRRGTLPKDEVIESRVIVLPDGSRRGGFKKRSIAVFANNQPP
jgi:hypothetical protein